MWGFLQPTLHIQQFARRTHITHWKLYTYDYRFIRKKQPNRRDAQSKVCFGRGGGCSTSVPLSLWGQGVSPSQHISVYTNREAVPRFRVQSSYGGVITWTWLIQPFAMWLAQSPGPPSSPKLGVWSWKFQTSHHIWSFCCDQNYPSIHHESR